MPTTNPLQHKKKLKQALAQLYKTQHNPAPSHYNDLYDYIHPNHVVRWVAWQRLQQTLMLVQQYCNPSMTLMDFGSSGGILAFFLAHQGYEVIYVHFDLTPLRQLRNFIAFPSNIFLWEGDLLQSPFKPDSLDAVISVDLVAWLQRPEAYLDYFDRLLVRRGILLLQAPIQKRSLLERFTKNHFRQRYKRATKAEHLTTLFHSFFIVEQHFLPKRWLPLFQMWLLRTR